MNLKTAQFKDPLLDAQIEKLAFYLEEGWTDINGQVVVKGTGSNDPTWKAFSGNFWGYAFEPATKMNEAWIDFHIPHDINPTRPIYFHVHWSPADNTAGTVRWGIELVHADPLTAFSTTRTVYLENAAAEAFPYHQVVECTEAEAIPGETLVPGGVIMARLFRDATHANDTYAGDAFPWFLNLHYRADRQGTPNKEGNLYL